MTCIKYISVFAVLLLAAACATQQIYNISLSSVESPTNAKVKWGETKIVTTNQNGEPRHHYEDDYIKIYWRVELTGFNFNLTNKTPYSMKVNWDEMVYVDENGVAQRVMHQGVKYINRNESQPHSIIPKYCSLNDIIIPTNKVHFDTAGTGKWVEEPIFPIFSTMDEALSSGILGKSFRIMFPIIIQDVQNEYIFEFKIDYISSVLL